MKSRAKKYNTAYKKKVDVHRDTFLPRRSPAEIIQCGGCGAFYHRRHWTLVPPSGLPSRLHTHPVYCPACRKIKQRCPSGEVRLMGVDRETRGEIFRLLRNEERRAQETNPLEKIMGLDRTDGDWKLQTTTEKLAQRLGRAVGKARGGKVAYKWSHNNKFVTVVWRGVAPEGERRG